MLTEEQLLQIEERTDDNAQSLNYFCTDLHDDVRRYLKHVDDVRVLLEAIRESQARVTELEKQHTDDDVRFALHLNRAMAAEEKSALAEMRAIGQKLHIEAVEAKVEELRERLAAQEPDATLGRLVREGREAM
jgi:hypothetical protein